jgi:hypothetical protein
VLRPGGFLVAIESPMYRNRRARAQAQARSEAYYATAGFPELATHYHPIDVTALRATLESASFEVLRLDAGSTARRWWERVARPRRSTFLLARSIPG